MRMITTQVDIDAPPRVVWEVLIDFPAYERDGWNGYLTSIEATLVPGERVTARTYTTQLGSRRLTARLIGVTFPELSWEAKLPIPGIIQAIHRFRVEPLSPERTQLVQSECVSGLLTGAFFHLVEKSESGFHAFNAAIKHRAEARAA